MTDSRPSYATSSEANTVIPRLVTESRYLHKTLPAFTEALQAFLANQDDPVGTRMYDLRMMAQHLQWSFKQMGSLLAVLDGTPKAEAGQIDPDLLALLQTLGLTITLHDDRARGWGYIWQGRSWQGPHLTQIGAVQAAFEDAVCVISEHPNMPA